MDASENLRENGEGYDESTRSNVPAHSDRGANTMATGEAAALIVRFSSITLTLRKSPSRAERGVQS